MTERHYRRLIRKDNRRGKAREKDEKLNELLEEERFVKQKTGQIVSAIKEVNYNGMRIFMNDLPDFIRADQFILVERIVEKVKKKYKFLTFNTTKTNYGFDIDWKYDKEDEVIKEEE